MAAGKTKRNLDEIDDIGEMFEVMKALDISSKGLKSLEDMKERVKTIIGEASKPTSWNAGQETVFAFVNSIIEDRMAAECCHDPTLPTRTFPEQHAGKAPSLQTCSHGTDCHAESPAVQPASLLSRKYLLVEGKEFFCSWKVSKFLHLASFVNARKVDVSEFQAYSVLSDAHDEDVRKRRILLNLYTEAQKTVTKLDSTIYNILEQNIGNVKGKVENNINQLQLKEYFVLVAEIQNALPVIRRVQSAVCKCHTPILELVEKAQGFRYVYCPEKTCFMFAPVSEWKEDMDLASYTLCPCNDIFKRLDFLVFSDKGEKP
ncbi:unnamed protein product [Porites evermanni]|uniref:Uncharacterized protein n=1 Tax=Porites evermanni TaxID=104178 RepID=A0ABN8M5V1_9CNID|nr:unnamed protein product [Porites evermanni]